MLVKSKHNMIESEEELKKEYPGFEVIERVNYIEWGKNNGKK